MTAVRKWPSYLLNGIPPDLRRLLTKEARKLDISIGDTVRGILCAHYQMDCPPVSRLHVRSKTPRQISSLLLRLQPELYMQVGVDAINQRKTKRQVILDALWSHYGGEPS